MFCFFTFDFVAKIASLELVENDVDWESLWQWGLLGEDFLWDQSPNDAKGHGGEGTLEGGEAVAVALP